jgi:hypothetical protein
MDPADPHQADPTDAVRCIDRLVIGTSACPAIMRASDSSLKGPARASLGGIRGYHVLMNVLAWCRACVVLTCEAVRELALTAERN